MIRGSTGRVTAFAGGVAVAGLAAGAGLYAPVQAVTPDNVRTSSLSPLTRTTSRVLTKRLASRAVGTIKVLGVGGIPSTGVDSVRATVSVRSRGRGTLRIRPATKGRATKRGTAKVRVRSSHRGVATIQLRPGSGGRWTLVNRTGRKARVVIVLRGFVRSFVTNPCARTSQGNAKWDHVIWIVLENHGPAAVVNNSAAPYLNTLIERCGLATNMWALTHPSAPNYVALTAGAMFGVTADVATLDKPSILSQLGKDNWRVLTESMPQNCYRSNYQGYVSRHNPALFFKNIAGQCLHQNLPLTARPDLSARFTMIVPNQYHNAHDSDSVNPADVYLSGLVPKILNSTQYRAGKTALFITFDENEGSQPHPNQVSTIVVAPSVKAGTKSATYFTHYSLLRTTEAMLYLPYLENARYATGMRDAFNLK
jgi:phosphatidylinositol-3-phosphatase